MQNLGSTGRPFLVTLNPPRIPKHKLLQWYTSHPFPSVAASKASLELDKIQGKRTIWFSGAYQGKAKISHREFLSTFYNGAKCMNQCQA